MLGKSHPERIVFLLVLRQVDIGHEVHAVKLQVRLSVEHRSSPFPAARNRNTVAPLTRSQRMRRHVGDEEVGHCGIGALPLDRQSAPSLGVVPSDSVSLVFAPHRRAVSMRRRLTYRTTCWNSEHRDLAVQRKAFRHVRSQHTNRRRVCAMARTRYFSPSENLLRYRESKRAVGMQACAVSARCAGDSKQDGLRTDQ